MGRKKRHDDHEDHVDESWLIPYADMLTLLLALFIVLFASSQVDASKFRAISNTFNEVLKGGSGVLEQSPSIIEPMEELPVSLPDKPEEQEVTKEEDSKMTAEEDMQELKELKEKIDTYIQEKKLASYLKTDLTGEGLMITIREAALYGSGQASLSQDAKKLAREISRLLVTDPPRHITVTGHTDNQPIHNSDFPSNWHLSSERALNFMAELLKNKKLNPRLFSFTGYGEFRPIASNDTAEGRAKNRRVEVLILPYDEKN
ncbi:flagellar motor protein MotB [Pseudalkalibacillus caeni]|uniref:Flagellar motor protein MotB n=1 Tax=Exobacillus caeni TaxID=2574798 RepID=A0A5R9F261_9BACL|nr:flagellar motor protein MotB [Pseudalkalibacillus caeni]TLS36619.1 flagellar motor protein MotB [Pseudalkalibacillus caeni]